MSSEPRTRPGRHVGLLLLIVLVVLALHAAVTYEIGQRMSIAEASAPGMHRMKAVYVTELKLSRPPACPRGHLQGLYQAV